MKIKKRMLAQVCLIASLTQFTATAQTYGTPTIAKTSKYLSTVTLNKNVEYSLSPTTITTFSNGKKVNTSDPTIKIEGSTLNFTHLFFIDNEIHVLSQEGSFLHDKWKIYRLIFDKDLNLKGKPTLVSTNEVGSKYGIPQLGSKNPFIKFTEFYSLSNTNQQYNFHSTNQLLDNPKKDSYAHYHILDNEGKVVSQYGISSTGDAVVRQFKPLCVFDDGSAFIAYMEGTMTTSFYGNYPTFTSQAILYVPSDGGKPRMEEELQITPTYRKVGGQIAFNEKTSKGEHVLAFFSENEHKGAFNIKRFNPEKGTIVEQEVLIEDGTKYDFSSNQVLGQLLLKNGSVAFTLGRSNHNMQDDLTIVVISAEGQLKSVTPLKYTTLLYNHLKGVIMYEDDEGNPHVFFNAHPKSIVDKKIISKTFKIDPVNAIQADVAIDYSTGNYTINPLKRPQSLTGAMYLNEYTTLDNNHYRIKVFIDKKWQFVEVKF